MHTAPPVHEQIALDADGLPVEELAPAPDYIERVTILRPKARS